MIIAHNRRILFSMFPEWYREHGLDAWPFLILEATGKEERDAAWHLRGRFDDLDKYLNDFGTALKLADFCDNAMIFSREPHSSWQTIAMRDAAMTIFHFGKVLHSVAEGVRLKCPILFGVIDQDALRAASRTFQSHFRQSTKVRHAVGHSAELGATIERRMQEAHYGPYEDDVLSAPIPIEGLTVDMMVGRRLTKTIGNQIVSIEVTTETFEHLKQIRQLVCLAFTAAKEPLRSLAFDDPKPTTPPSRSGGG